MHPQSRTGYTPGAGGLPLTPMRGRKSVPKHGVLSISTSRKNVLFAMSAPPASKNSTLIVFMPLSITVVGRRAARYGLYQSSLGSRIMYALVTVGEAVEGVSTNFATELLHL